MLKGVMERYIKWIGGTAYYYRKIPKDLQAVIGAVHVQQSLKTNVPAEIIERRDKLNQKYEAYWAACRGDESESEARRNYDQMVAEANLRGFDYMPFSKLSEAPASEWVNRAMEIGTVKGEAKQAKVADALLGAVEKPNPDLLLSVAMNMYWEFNEDLLIQKSDGQKRIWRVARERAVRNFIEVVGDKDITTITKADAMKFRSWWMVRVKSGEIKANTANKDIEHLRAILNLLFEKLDIDLNNPFSRMLIRQGKKDERIPLNKAQIQNHIYAPGKLDGMNDQLRHVVCICAELGARPIEIFTRAPEDIILDGPIPHIKIRENKFGLLKTQESRRDLPLIGPALEAFQAYPNGFPRYATKTASGVSAISKYFSFHLEE